MDRVLSIALASMNQDMNRLDRVAFNLVNIATPGFKREVNTTRPFTEFFEQTAASFPGDGLLPHGIRSMPLEVALDLRPGSQKLTGAPLDLALTGDGFFEIVTENGPAYTRQGNFHVDAHGRLVSAQGLPVSGREGEIFLTTQTPQIDAFGNISEPDATPGIQSGQRHSIVAQIKVVRFENTHGMRHFGDGLLTPGEGMLTALPKVGPIRQGMLENSNVSHSQEMVELIQTMRHFESVQKAAKGYHEMIGVAIHKLGELS